MLKSKKRLLELNSELAENLTDKGVEATSEETTTALVDKVAEISGGSDDFVGVKYSDFDNVNSYYLPQTADARSLDKCMMDDNSKRSMCTNLFSSGSTTSNNNRSAGLKTIYMPEKMISLENTFAGCILLTTIIGDLTNVTSIGGTFDGCSSLKELPYFPNLKTLQNNAVRNCTSLTRITFHKVLTLWHTGALTGCKNITDITLADGWNTAVYAQHCQDLTQASLHDMIDKYADMTGKTSPVMNVGSTNLEKIDEAHKAMATAKNITLA